MSGVRRAFLVALLFGGALALPRGALGHALLVASDPASGTTVGMAPSAVVLTFGEAPDPRLSKVKVLDTSGTDHAGGPPEAVAGKPEELRVPLAGLADGVYTVAWRTVSAVDGHVAAGSFAFGVGLATVVSAPAAVEGSGGVTGGWPAVIARWLLYAGLAGLLGASLVGSILHPRPPRRLLGVATVGWIVAAVGTVAVVAFQWLDSGAGLAAFLASALGLIVVARIAMILVAGAMIAALRVQPWAGRATRRLLWLVMPMAAVALLVDVLGGHAAAGDSALLAIGVQWVHALTSGLWMGGLVALLVVVRGLPSDEKTLAVRRYSTWAGVLIGLVALTGITRAIVQVGTVGALIGSDFGRLVILKSGGLMALGALGAFNRFINVPRVAATLTGLRRAGSLEVSVGAAVFLLTAALVNAAPPSAGGAQASPGQPPLIATGHDFGTSVRVQLTVTPATAGFNSFSAAVSDYDTGAPAPATAVGLRFTLASRTGVGSSSLALPGSGPGIFEASGGNLSIDGIWRVTTVVTGPSGVVEVPFVLATRVAPQPTTADTSIKPVVHVISLPGGDTVQIYLDPGTPGANDLHMTFFDPAGHELPVPSVTAAVSGPAQPGDLLAPRTLEPGHFDAHLDSVPAGSLAVDVVGTGSDGNPLHAYLAIEVAP